MSVDRRIENEIKHGQLIAREGEQIWNWSSPAGKKRWQRRCDMFSSFLGDRNRDVLEVGCGTGLFTSEIAKTKNKITAIDISPDLLEISKKRMGGMVVCLRRNAYQTDFPDDSFDFVVGSSVLHHLEVPAAIREFYRILRPGGKLMFTEPNMLNPQIAVQKNISFIKKLAGDSPDETAFFRWSIINELADAKFRNASAVPFDFMHPAVPGFLVGYLEPIFGVLEHIPVMKEFAGSLVISADK